MFLTCTPRDTVHGAQKSRAVGSYAAHVGHSPPKGLYMKNNTIQGSLQVGNPCITVKYNGKTGVVSVEQSNTYVYTKYSTYMMLFHLRLYSLK